MSNIKTYLESQDATNLDGTFTLPSEPEALTPDEFTCEGDYFRLGADLTCYSDELIAAGINTEFGNNGVERALVERGILREEERDAEYSAFYGIFRTMDRVREFCAAFNALVGARS